MGEWVSRWMHACIDGWMDSWDRWGDSVQRQGAITFRRLHSEGMRGETCRWKRDRTESEKPGKKETKLRHRIHSLHIQLREPHCRSQPPSPQPCLLPQIQPHHFFRKSREVPGWPVTELKRGTKIPSSNGPPHPWAKDWKGVVRKDPTPQHHASL